VERKKPVLARRRVLDPAYDNEKRRFKDIN
jgi:hypothetical protein